ncbi:Na(+) H(+) antiporter subunit A [hydrothermal vent metagenome]|uniref:Na(+) H(+) antiporter subunit A n=1 Tax=hydrothermal vent metagenome TaxID=652676 RepID=A0A3B0Y104_9ZZZZ
MTDFIIPPALMLIVTAFIIPFIKGSVRTAVLLLVPLLTLLIILIWPDNTQIHAEFLDYKLTIVNKTIWSTVFGIIFCIMAFAGNLFAYRHATTLELSAAMFYAGSALGVVFAGDLLTLFVFWELMAIGSTMILVAAGTSLASRAAFRYIMIHLLGGVILMAGITLYVSQTGNIEFINMTDQIEKPAVWLILAGFLINAGAPPFSSWLADAYPEASVSGSVYLSAFTTKTAVYVLLVGFAGSKVLIFIGLYMVFYGIIYALLENDMRRILAYSIINQVGFMITGIGIGTPLALNGVAAHAFCHIIYKALLLMSAGSVLLQTGKRKCTDLGGLFQTMPVTALCGIIGALSISAFPLTSGFISKSMISSAAEHENLIFVWYLLVAATAGVFLHAGIKFPWFVFFQKDSGMRPDEPPLNMRLAMMLFSFLCLGLGIYPEPLYALLDWNKVAMYQAYTSGHIVSQLQLLLFSGLAFFILLPMMKRTLTISLDFDWLYRVILFKQANKIQHLFSTLGHKLSLQGASLRTLYSEYSGESHLAVWSRSIYGMVTLSLIVFCGLLILFLFL